MSDWGGTVDVPRLKDEWWRHLQRQDTGRPEGDMGPQHISSSSGTLPVIPGSSGEIEPLSGKMASVSGHLLALLSFFQCLASAAYVEPKELVECLIYHGVPITSTATPFITANASLLYTPAAVVRPTTPQYVSNAVVCASSANIKVQTLSGGHSYGSYSTGGKNGSLVVHLEALQQIIVDNTTGIATVGAGVRLGNLALGLFNQGKRAVPHGTCPG